MNNIPIFLICDDNYTPYMATMIASICYNTKSLINFHVIGKGTSDNNKAQIEKMKNTFKNFAIDYKVFDATESFNIPYLSLSRMTSSTFIRMSLPDLYPELTRALVMDVDIISLQDIVKLWEIDLEDYHFAAALDKPFDAYYKFKKCMNVDVDCNYANCGVMLLNCEKWRKDKITQKCLDIEKKYRDNLTCADQDVINKIFLGKFKLLDCKYNSLLGNDNDIINRHFCHLRKPWLSKYNIEGDEIKNFDDWWRFAKMTPFYNQLKLKYEEFNNGSKNNSPKETQTQYRKMEAIALARNLLKRKQNCPK